MLVVSTDFKGDIELLSEKDQKDFDQNKFTIDCPRMVLERGAGAPKKIEGAGSIYQVSDGTLHFKIFAMESSSAETELFFSHGIPGTIISDDQIFRLMANDMQGNVWIAEKVFANIQMNLDNPATIASGNLYSISSTKKIEGKSLGRNIRAIFYQAVDVPSNQTVEISTSVAQKEMHSKTSRTAAEIDNEDYRILIWKEDGVLHLASYPKKSDFGHNYEVNVVDALAFVLSRPISWSVQETMTDDQRILTLRAKPDEGGKYRSKCPVNDMRVHYKHTWRLFDLYFRFLLKDLSKGRHPVACHINSILEASSGSLLAEGLTLATEIEGFLKDEFYESHEIPQKARDEAQKLLQAVDVVEADENLKNRAKGCINNILSVRPLDILRKLVEQNIIKHELVSAWQELRNRTAHAYSIDATNVQEFIDLCNKSTVLLYQLIFIRIGYSGEYVDYSKHGYPDAIFNISKNI